MLRGGGTSKLDATLQLQRRRPFAAQAAPGLSFDELAATAECPGANWSAVAFMHVPKAAGAWGIWACWDSLCMRHTFGLQHSCRPAKAQ